MIDSWENLLTSILTSIPNNYKIKIIHYTPQDTNNIIEKTAGIDRKICKERLLSTECNISFFPKRGLYNEEKHIIIDMAHLVSYSLILYSKNENDSSGYDKFRYDNYSGYDEKYMKKFNYVYLGYDTFLRKDDLVDLKLFEMKESGRVITIHHILEDLGILQLYEDANVDLINKISNYITKTTRESNTLIFGDMLPLKDKIDFLWKKWEDRPSKRRKKVEVPERLTNDLFDDPTLLKRYQKAIGTEMLARRFMTKEENKAYDSNVDIFNLDEVLDNDLYWTARQKLSKLRTRILDTTRVRDTYITCQV